MIICGFPSQIAALQFEWALQNPHLTTHMTAEERIQQPTKGKGRRPAPPRRSLNSVLGNLHLLLRVPSFSRWPLELRFFSREVYNVFQKTTDKNVAELPEHILTHTSFPATAQGQEARPMHEDCSHPIYGLETDYRGLTEWVGKTRSMAEGGGEGSCGVCGEILAHDRSGRGREEVWVACPKEECQMTSHVRCLSRQFLDEEKKKNGDEHKGDAPLLPISGTCPSCGTNLKWVDLVKEATLRNRGSNEVSVLLKRKAAREKKAAKLDAASMAAKKRRGADGKIAASQVIPDTDESAEDWEEDIPSESEVDVDNLPHDEDNDDGFIELDELVPAGNAEKFMIVDIGTSKFEMVCVANGEKKMERLKEETGLPTEGGRKWNDVVEIADTDEESEGSWKDAVELD